MVEGFVCLCRLPRVTVKDGYLKEKDTFFLTRHKSALYVIEIAGLSIEALAPNNHG